MVACPICNKPVKEASINSHIDSECRDYLDEPTPPPTQTSGAKAKTKNASAFFTPASKKTVSFKDEHAGPESSPIVSRGFSGTQKPALKRPPSTAPGPAPGPAPTNAAKRPLQDEEPAVDTETKPELPQPAAKKQKSVHAPLAERMRPQSLDDVAGQELVGPNGVLRNLIVTDRVPSMILWGGPGTGKTTIARLIAHTAGT